MKQRRVLPWARRRRRRRRSFPSSRSGDRTGQLFAVRRLSIDLAAALFNLQSNYWCRAAGGSVGCNPKAEERKGCGPWDALGLGRSMGI